MLQFLERSDSEQQNFWSTTTKFPFREIISFLQVYNQFVQTRILQPGIGLDRAWVLGKISWVGSGAEYNHKLGFGPAISNISYEWEI